MFIIEKMEKDSKYFHVSSFATASLIEAMNKANHKTVFTSFGDILRIVYYNNDRSRCREIVRLHCGSNGEFVLEEVNTDGENDGHELHQCAGVVLNPADLGEMQADLFGRRDLVVEGSHGPAPAAFCRCAARACPLNGKVKARKPGSAPRSGAALPSML